MRAFCITLPETPERTERCRAHFAQAGLTDVEFFTGINAAVAGLSTSHAYELDAPGSGYRIGAKRTGTWLSHYMLWLCLTRLPDEHFLVFEDNALLCEGFPEKLASAMRDVPQNFDLLFPGSCCAQNNPKTHIAGDVYESKAMMCTHGYVVRRGALGILLAMRKMWAPLDIQMKLECYPQLRTYAVLPRIVEQFAHGLEP